MDFNFPLVPRSVLDSPEGVEKLRKLVRILEIARADFSGKLACAGDVIKVVWELPSNQETEVKETKEEVKPSQEAIDLANIVLGI